jgi:ethanolamine utilization protein EutA
LPHDHADDHEHDERGHVLWKRDRIELRSVGIDIGSSTSHLIFSTLELRRQSAVLSSRFELFKRRIDYQSGILLTPFATGTSIDTDKLSTFFEAAYQEARVTPAEVDTGAVITTGDAARKDNAEAIVRMFSEQAGKFVCASAGPVLEAKMAAYGSGAVARSADGHRPATVLNVDIGGGTAKLAVVRNGEILETAAINVGARLVTLDPDGVVTKVERAAEIVSRHLGLGLEVGRPADAETQRRLASALARSVMEAAARGPLSPLAAELMITAPLAHRGAIDAALFSGGVAEYFYETETRFYGDIGLPLAEEVRRLAPSYLPGVPIEAAAQRIRATVIGASQFTVQVSGNTIYVANPAILPLRNLQVIPVQFEARELTPAGVGRAIRRAFEAYEVRDGESRIALTVRWPHGPAFSRLSALSWGIADVYRRAARGGEPVVLVLDSDLARLVGANVSGELDGYTNLVCIDGVQLQDFDYIDIGEPHADAGVVTVVIKSLVFTG